MTRNNVFSVEPLIRLLKEVIQEEESREILQADLIHLLPYSTIFLEDQLPEAVPETLKVWLQLLHNCLTQAKSILYHPNSRQRCLDCLSNNPKRSSEQIKNWRVHFNYLFHGLESDFSVIVRGREAVIAPVITPILPLMKDVIEEEENREILETELRPVYNLLLDISVSSKINRKWPQSTSRFGCNCCVNPLQRRIPYSIPTVHHNDKGMDGVWTVSLATAGDPLNNTKNGR